MPVGSVFNIRQGGAGKLTVVPAAGVTVLYNETLITRKSESVFTLIKTGTDTWDLTGDMELAV
jgi:hypothetical protein